MWCGERQDQGLISGHPGTDLGQGVPRMDGENVVAT